MGEQAAVLVATDLAREPVVGPAAINRVLARLGVDAGPHGDAFEAIGLDQVRGAL